MQGNPLHTTQSIKISGLGAQQFNDSMAAVLDAYVLFEQHLPANALHKWTTEWIGSEGSHEQAMSFHNSIFVTRSLARANSDDGDITVTDEMDPLGHLRRMQSMYLYTMKVSYAYYLHRKTRTHGG